MICAVPDAEGGCGACRWWAVIQHREQSGRVQRRTGRAPALLVLTALLLLPAALLNGSAGVPSTAAVVLGGATAIGALATLTVWTVRVMLPPGVLSGARHVLDVAGALLLTPAIALGFALHPLAEASSPPALDVAVLLVVPSVALIALLVVFSALRLYRDAGTLRTVLLRPLEDSGRIGVDAVLLAPAATVLVVVCVAVSTSVLAGAEGLRLTALLGWSDLTVTEGVPRVLAGAVAGVVAAVVASVATSLLVYRRITALNVSHEQARTDDLTGLGNRRVLMARLDETSQGEPLALVDLDRFKAVNDVLGHDAGDELLRQVAARLCSLARPEDLVARQSGDEFALVLAGVGTAAAAGRAREVVTALREPFVLPPRTRRSDDGHDGHRGAAARGRRRDVPGQARRRRGAGARWLGASRGAGRARDGGHRPVTSWASRGGGKMAW